MNPLIRVLYVDDNPLDRELVRDALEKEQEGFRVTEAASRREFEARLQEDDFDLVLSDFNILGFEGLQVIAAVKAKDPYLPVIIVTGTGSEEIAVEAMRSGASDYVIKTPRHIQRLPITIKKVLERRQLRAEKARSVAELREARRDWEEIFQAIGHPTLILDPEYNVIIANRATCQAVKQSAAELRGKKCYEIFHGSQHSPENCPLKKMLHSGRLEAREMEMDALGGVFIVSCTPVLDEAGRLKKIIHIATDITAHKRAEEELRKETAFTKTAINSMPGVFYLFDAQGKILRWNENLKAASGYSAAELSRMHPLDLFGEPDKTKIQAAIREVFEKGEAMVEADLLSGNGLRIPFLFTGRRITLDGKPCLTGLGIDISGRKLAEEALRKSEEKYRRLVQQIPAVVYKGHRDWTLECFDQKIEEITGYSMEEFNSREKTWLDLIFPDYPDQAKKLFEEARQGDGSYVIEHRIRKKTGEVRWIQSRNRIIRNTAGEFDYISGVFFDITERKKLEDQLIKAQKMEAIGILAGGVAHDFNNLLTAIMGYSEIMMMGLRPEDPFHLYVEEITKAVNRGASLTNQLLAFSRKQIFQPRVINLNGVVHDMDNMLRRLIGEDIDLITVMDQELGLVKADPGQIEQIIMNLAVNARDAMPHGGKLTIETANVYFDPAYAQEHEDVPPGTHVMLAVSDNGTGMDAVTLSHIFEPFFTTKESGKGTGLGLATVYGIVKQSGGNIWVYSEPGQGSTFKIYLPRVEESLDTVKPKTVPVTSLEGQETILLVEDDVGLRELISRALRKYGFTVLEAAQGSEALLICEREKSPIHLLLTDVVMPQISGIALAGQLKLLHPEMQVLFMSGYTEDAMVHHGILNSNVNFISKPFRMVALVQKVREVLDTTSPS